MDVERTMQFILEMQARHEANWAESDKRWAESDKRRAENDKRWAENDRRWARNERRINRLAQLGMRALDEQGNRINILISSLQELSEAQKVTETKMQSWLDSMRKGGNGGTTP
ncbi:MAG: hypothetical protein LAP87_01950 [Acidobacteriia bacterium]|nr:hypothetical protein [Terriglobia bacterium]